MLIQEFTTEEFVKFQQDRYNKYFSVYMYLVYWLKRLPLPSDRVVEGSSPTGSFNWKMNVSSDTQILLTLDIWSQTWGCDRI
jgi:hypothetical protein